MISRGRINMKYILSFSPFLQLQLKIPLSSKAKSAEGTPIFSREIIPLTIEGVKNRLLRICAKSGRTRLLMNYSGFCVILIRTFLGYDDRAYFERNIMKTVYTCFSTDVIHEGHLNIIKEAQKYGRVVVGCLSDKASIRYNRFPTVSEKNRMELYKTIEGVDSVVLQNDMLYDDVIEYLKPD